MKMKALIWVGIVLQLGFVLFILFNAPEPVGAIKVGLQKLQAAYPSEAPTTPDLTTGNIALSTLGDWFSAASNGFAFQSAVTLSFAAVNILLFACLLVILRSKKGASSPAGSRVD